MVEKSSPLSLMLFQNISPKEFQNLTLIEGMRDVSPLLPFGESQKCWTGPGDFRQKRNEQVGIVSAHSNPK